MESFSHDFPDLENIVQLPDLLDDYSDNNSLSELAQSSASATDQSLSRKSEEYVKPKTTSKENDKGKKSKINPNGTKKVKVNWTPELHQRFVEAVEMLGIDNAVPSKILELMGVDYLTRHNIASHLQKYRSHQKYLRVREAELASLTQRRQMHIPTSMAFPPHFTPPLVWGHPWFYQPLMHAPVASSLTGTPYFPTPVAPTSSPNGLPVQIIPSPPCDIHPSKESVDAAVQEVLAKPWLPLPLGLKPPSFERSFADRSKQEDLILKQEEPRVRVRGRRLGISESVTDAGHKEIWEEREAKS